MNKREKITLWAACFFGALAFGGLPTAFLYMQVTYWVPTIGGVFWVWKKYSSGAERVGILLATLGILLWYAYYWLRYKGQGI